MPLPQMPDLLVHANQVVQHGVETTVNGDAADLCAPKRSCRLRSGSAHLRINNLFMLVLCQSIRIQVLSRNLDRNPYFSKPDIRLRYL